MKMKAIALALFIAGACASYALAGDGHGKGSDQASTTTQSTSSTETDSHGHGHGQGRNGACREHVAFVLNGTFVSAAGDGSSFQMQVMHANHHARALGNPATVGVDANTHYRKQGQAVTLADLKAGDRVNVQARCVPAAAPAAPGAAPAPLTVVARRVVVKGPQGSGDGGDGHGTTTTTAVTTTTSNG